MSEFISDIQTIPYNEEEIFRVLSNMSHLERMKDRIPQEQIKDFSFDEDSCSFTVNPVGKIKFTIVERDPFKTIKLAASETPIEVNLWIQLKQTQENETKMKLTVRADLNPFFQSMIAKPLQDGINRVAGLLAVIPYGDF